MKSILSLQHVLGQLAQVRARMFEVDDYNTLDHLSVRYKALWKQKVSMKKQLLQALHDKAILREAQVTQLLPRSVSCPELSCRKASPKPQIRRASLTN